MKSITLYIYTQNNIARNNREISSPLTHISIFIVFIIFLFKQSKQRYYFKTIIVV